MASRQTVVRLCLVGSLVLAGLCILSIPPPRSWLRSDPTPFDNGPTRSVASAYALLRKAAAVIPIGASVMARQVPSNAQADTYFFKAAVALLPDRVVLPAAIWSRPTLDLQSEAEFLVILGKLETNPGFSRVLETTGGAVWRRTPR